MDLGPASDHVVHDDAPVTDVAWLGPYPDPPGRAERREDVELAFVAALQHLPANQRAALLLFEVLGFSAAEIAELMQTSGRPVNSALQRARKLVAERVPARSEAPGRRAVGDTRTRELVTAYSDALDRGDPAALVALLTSDVTWSMPPLPHWYRGIDVVRAFARGRAAGQLRTLAAPDRVGQRATRRGVLAATGRRAGAHGLVHRRAHGARRADRGDHLVHRPRALRGVRAAARGP
jgi:RNA polymerase sigma-70 factor (ECF subfamily)